MKWEIGERYTVVRVGEWTAMTQKDEIVIKGMDGEMPVFCLRGRRTSLTFGHDGEKLRKGTLVFAGWGIPLKTDVELYRTGVPIHGNGCFNFIGDPGEVRGFIGKNNLNPDFSHWDRILARRTGARDEEEVCVFPEAPTGRAVVERMREEQRKRQAQEAGA